MPKLSQLAKGESTLLFLPFEGASEKVEITYRPHKLTPSVRGRVKDAIEKGDDTPIAEWLVETLVKWDIEDEKGKTLPITVENILELPNAFVGILFDEIARDAADLPEVRSGT